jgi:predicted Zn-dependent protease
MSRELSALKLVPLGSPIPSSALHALGQHLARAFAQVLSKIEIVERDPIPVDQIEAGLLTQALHQELGGHILAITDVDLFDSKSDDFSRYMLGGKDNRNDVAVVSTRRLNRRAEPSDSPTGRSFERLVKVSLHELGHNFGLVHHYTNVTEPGGDYCPMTKGDCNRYGERGYLRAVVDARGLAFCRDCLAFIRCKAQLQRC